MNIFQLLIMWLIFRLTDGCVGHRIGNVLGKAVFQQQWDDMLGMACRYRPRMEGEMAARGAGNRETLTPVFFNFSTGSRRPIFERQLKLILILCDPVCRAAAHSGDRK